MAIGKLCTRIKNDGYYYLSLAIIKQAKTDSSDMSLSEACRQDACRFMHSKGIGGMYDLCLNIRTADLNNKKVKNICSKG